MFEFFGALVRLPAALAGIAFLFVTWPIGAAFLLGVAAIALAITPFKFVGYAFSGDKSGWQEWAKTITDVEGFVRALFYPITQIPSILKWVETGR